MKLRAYGHTVEKLFYLKPGARPDRIKLRLVGGKRLSVTDDGELAVHTEQGLVTFSKPVAYQGDDGAREVVPVAYVVNESEYGFVVGAYDETRELVIDPILASTFIGGSGSGQPIADQAFAIALDQIGNVYVAGITRSPDFPGIGASSVDRSFVVAEAFVAKLNPALTLRRASPTPARN